MSTTRVSREGTTVKRQSATVAVSRKKLTTRQNELLSQLRDFTRNAQHDTRSGSIWETSSTSLKEIADSGAMSPREQSEFENGIFLKSDTEACCPLSLTEFSDSHRDLLENRKEILSSLVERELGSVISVVASFQRLVDRSSDYKNTITAMKTKFEELQRIISEMSSAISSLDEERTGLEEFRKKIQLSLMHFASHPQLQAYFNSASLKATDPTFVKNMERVGANIRYLESHLEFKDANLYLSLFKNVRARLMALIRTFVSTEIDLCSKKVKAEINAAIATREESPSSSGLVYESIAYAKYRTLAGGFRPAIVEILKSVKSRSHDEREVFWGLLEDIVGKYIASRRAILSVAVNFHPEQKPQSQVHSEPRVSESLLRFTLQMTAVTRMECLLFDYLFDSESTSSLATDLVTHIGEKWDRMGIGGVRPLVLSSHSVEDLGDCLTLLDEKCINLLSSFTHNLPLPVEESNNEGEKSRLLQMIFQIKESADESLKTLNLDIQERLLYIAREMTRDDLKTTSLTESETQNIIGSYARQVVDVKDTLGDPGSSMLPLGRESVCPALPPLQRAAKMLSLLFSCVNKDASNLFGHDIIHLCLDLIREASKMVATEISVQSKAHEAKSPEDAQKSPKQEKEGILLLPDKSFVDIFALVNMDHLRVMLSPFEAQLQPILDKQFHIGNFRLNTSPVNINASLDLVFEIKKLAGSISNEILRATKSDEEVRTLVSGLEGLCGKKICAKIDDQVTLKLKQEHGDSA